MIHFEWTQSSSWMSSSGTFVSRTILCLFLNNVDLNQTNLQGYHRFTWTLWPQHLRILLCNMGTFFVRICYWSHTDTSALIGSRVHNPAFGRESDAGGFNVFYWHHWIQMHMLGWDLIAGSHKTFTPKTPVLMKPIALLCFQRMTDTKVTA